KNLVRVDEVQLPAKVRDYQRALVEGLSGTRYLIDEFVGFDQGGLQELTKVLEDNFRDTVGQYGFASSPLVWEDGEQFDELLFSGMHSSLLGELEPMAKVSAGVGAGFARALLQGRPPHSPPPPPPHRPTAP